MLGCILSSVYTVIFFLHIPHSPYTSITGMELDLLHEEQSDSDENDNQEQNNVQNMIF